MTSTTPRIITIALAILALAAPAAGASTMREGSPPLASSHHAHVYIIPAPAQQPQTTAPVQLTKSHQPAVRDDSGTSALVYILPGLVLLGMLAAAAAVVRSSRHPVRA